MAISGHTYREEVTAATCTQQGFTVHICTVCGDTFTDSHTEPIPHTFGEWAVLASATWTKEGQRQRQCTACAETQTEALPKVPVNWVAVIGIGAGILAAAVGSIVLIVAWRKKRR